MKQFLLAGPFCNNGWRHFTNMIPLIPTAARGMNVFHASQVVAGASCKLDNQASDSASEDPNWPWTTAPTFAAVSTPHSDLTLNVDVA